MMTETLYKIDKTSSLRDIPMEVRRELVWFFSYFRLSYLIHDLGVEFMIFRDNSPDARPQVKAFFNGISIMVLYPSDLETVRRFCNDRFYAMSLLQNYENIVVLDLGAFIGTSSLFFAKSHNVKKVFAYEIYPENYKRLYSNLSLNSSSIDIGKIHAFNCGIGVNDSDQNFVTYEYDPFFNGISEGCYAYRTLMGQFFNLSEVVIEKVTYQPIVKIFQDILKENSPLNDIFLKLDIEGMEYNVLPMLLNSNFSHLIKVIVGEFHRPGIEDIFKGTNFEFSYNETEFKMFGKNHGFFSAINLNAKAE